MTDKTSPTPDERLLKLVHRASAAGRVLRRLLAEQAATIALSDAELLVVWLCVGQNQGWVQSDLATAVGLSPAQMSGIVERLRQRGLIDMQRSTVDRRRQVWHATMAGGELLAALRPELSRIAAALDEYLDPAEQQTLCQLADRLAQAVHKIDSEIPAEATPLNAATLPHSGAAA